MSKFWSEIKAGRRGLAMLAVALAVVASLIGWTAASGANTTPITGQLLSGTVPRAVALAKNLGTLLPTQRISVALPLALPQRSALDAYVQGTYTPGSPDYRRFLTPAQFGQRFGAPAAEVNKVVKALQGLGLSTATPSVNHLDVQATATAGVLEHAFGVTLASFKLPHGRAFYANTSAIRLPAALSGLVNGVVGLDSSGAPQPQLTPARPVPMSKVARQATAQSGGASPCLTATLSGGYTAPDLAQAYDFDGLYAKGFHGEGMSAALVEFDDYHDSNVSTLESCYGLHTPVTRRLVDGGTGGPPGAGEAEDMADITTILAMLPKLSHLYVYEAPITSGVSLGDAAEVDLYNAFVTDDTAPVLSSSWGNCEELQSQAYNQLMASVAEEAAAQGQQIFDASGDSGAVDCRGAATPTGGSISVEQEAAVPWITGVGGTDLSVESTVAALKVHHEDTWNDGGSGGGGQSAVWPMPSWQASYLAATHVHPAGATDDCGAPSGQLCRMVPDISLNADPDAGGLLSQAPLPPQFFPTDVGSPGYATYCGTPNCNFLAELGLPILPIGGQPPAGAGGWYPIGGTSLATPLAAAAAVSWDQEAKQAGLGDVGFLNPLLYRVASDPAEYARDFHDITTDTNSDQYDSLDCPSGCNPQHLYAAGTGYDMATGLGSIDAAALGADLVAASAKVDLTPGSEAMYGYLKGPRTSQPVAVSSGFHNGTYKAKSSAKWLHVTATGKTGQSLKWYVTPSKLKRGTYHGKIAVRGPAGSSATLSVSYVVTPPAKIGVSPTTLHFSEPAISSNGSPTTATCGSTLWGDELQSSLGAPASTPVPASTRQSLQITNTGSKSSVLHWAAVFTTDTGEWLSQDENPAGNANGFQTTASQPLVPTEGTIAKGGTPATFKLASVANVDTLGGYPPMEQGTYGGKVEIRDLANPKTVVTVPAALVLGNGQGTPTIAANPTSFNVSLAPGGKSTVNLALSDSSRVCGYAYSVSVNAPWLSVSDDLYSGVVGSTAATAAPTADDTGEGNGYTPIAVDATGLTAGTYHGTIVVQSQNAEHNPTTVPITLTIS